MISPNLRIWNKMILTYVQDVFSLSRFRSLRPKIGITNPSRMVRLLNISFSWHDTNRSHIFSITGSLLIFSNNSLIPIYIPVIEARISSRKHLRVSVFLFSNKLPNRLLWVSFKYSLAKWLRKKPRGSDHYPAQSLLSSSQPFVQIFGLSIWVRSVAWHPEE